MFTTFSSGLSSVFWILFAAISLDIQVNVFVDGFRILQSPVMLQLEANALSELYRLVDQYDAINALVTIELMLESVRFMLINYAKTIVATISLD